jgi:hypothetical protein
MMDYKKYPSNWKEISHHIRFVRAGGCCEWCGLKNGSVGRRDKDGKWYAIEDIGLMSVEQTLALFGKTLKKKPTTIILTVHHIGVDLPSGEKGDCHNKMDVRPENLAALCQRCHLKADMPIHIANRKKTLAKKRAAKIAATGQISFLGDK